MSNKTVMLLSIVQLWKFFSHFGVRTLLILYLVDQLQYDDIAAFSLNAVFCGLIELSGIFGGYLADRYWGLRKAALIGSLILAIGYASLIFEPMLFLSMGLIILGSSLSSNIMALVGLNYAENDPARHQGYTRFYMMQNLGALAATLICAFVSMHYGFKWGFVVASSGMVIANGILCWGYSRLALEKTLPYDKRAWMPILLMVALFGVALMSVVSAEQLLLYLPWITAATLFGLGVYLVKQKILTQEKVYQLFLYLGGLILFFATEDQICSSLLLFAQRQTDQQLLGWKIPIAMITMLNPIVILACGAWIARKRIQMITPFALVAGSFGILASVTLLHLPSSILEIMCCVAVISFAELMIGPMVLSYTSEVAAKGRHGLIMGMVSVGFSLAFQLSGVLSKTVAVQSEALSSYVYGMGFAGISAIMLVGGVILHVLIKRCSRKKIPEVIESRSLF